MESIVRQEDFMKQRIARFMYGRYGIDKLCRTLVTVALILLVMSTFARSNLLYFLSLGVLVYSYYRAFSKNIQARYKEAMAYERFKGRIKGIPQRIRDMKTHKIFRCTGCGQRIRIPRHKGNVEITCPKCKNVFRGRTQNKRVTYQKNFLLFRTSLPRLFKRSGTKLKALFVKRRRFHMVLHKRKFFWYCVS